MKKVAVRLETVHTICLANKKIKLEINKDSNKSL